jgi:ADP-heptose:LPS heptosyltransferase
MAFNPQNILVIDFGQLGDVVLSLPALRAIREHFPQARMTIAVGKPGAAVIDLSGYADAKLVVDRVSLRDGPKLISIGRLLKLIKEVRRARFDFVIDLHSLSETNLLGFLSGAPKRLFARRPKRSLEFLANFDPLPPLEDTSPDKHLVDRYLDVLIPLGVRNAPRVPSLKTRPTDDLAVDGLLRKQRAGIGEPLIGIFPGAGHPSRRWPLERFAQLADHLVRNEGARIIVFAGPEEREATRQWRKLFPPATIFFDRLTIPQLAAAQARLAVFVSNDTGPMHLAAAVGTSVITLLARPTPNSFVPIGEHHRVVFSQNILEMTVEEVYTATCQSLAGRRTAVLFSG